MSNRMPVKPTLPKSILDMKFMKRTKDKLEREKKGSKLKEEDKATDSAHATVSNSSFIIEESITACEELINGRLSFNGMNPDIERQMEMDTIKTEDIETDVSDEQLSRQFKAFKRSRESSNTDAADYNTRIKKQRRM